MSISVRDVLAALQFEEPGRNFVQVASANFGLRETRKDQWGDADALNEGGGAPGRASPHEIPGVGSDHAKIGDRRPRGLGHHLVSFASGFVATQRLGGELLLEQVVEARRMQSPIPPRSGESVRVTRR